MGFDNDDRRIPVTVVTGFLGSGKTTLVNHILKGNHGLKLAVIENEFGEVGVDDGLVYETEEEVIEMMNGCICCTVRGDLIKVLEKLLKGRKRRKFDAIVIETTGLADPAPIAQTFLIDDKLRLQLRLDAILTLVDSKHIIQHLEDKKPEGVENESVEQLAFADKILLNKIDLVTGDEKAEIIKRIKEINNAAKIVETTYSKVDLKEILGIKAFDVERILEKEPDFLSPEESEHLHDSTVSSVGIEVEGELDIDRLNAWLSKLLHEKGEDLFRSKGLLAVHESEEKYVFQGVHMLLQFGSSASGLGRPWQKGEKRVNKLCFIGRNLNRKELEDSFKKCLVAQ